MRLEIVTAVSVKIIKITVFWDVRPCSSVDRHQLFGGTSFLLKIEKSNFFRKAGTYIYAVTSKKPSKLALTLLTCLRKMPDSNLGQDTSYINEIFRYFPQFIKKDVNLNCVTTLSSVPFGSLFTFTQTFDLVNLRY
jgi:hypothetical protein